MAKYYTVSELSLMTGLHRQTVYNKVREASNAGSELVKPPTASDGWLAQKGLFAKYIVEKNTEEVEPIPPDVIKLSERVYEDLLKERDALKAEVRELYERVLDSEAKSKKHEALYETFIGGLKPQEQLNEGSTQEKEEKPVEELKTHNNKPSTMEQLYVIIPALVVVASAVFYFFVVAG